MAAYHTNPENSDLVYCLGEACFYVERWVEAREYFHAALAKPDLGSALIHRAHYLLAYTHYKLGAYAQAIGLLEKLETEGFGEDVSSK